MHHRFSPRDFRSSHAQHQIQRKSAKNPQTQTPSKAVTSRRRTSAPSQTNDSSSTTALALGLLMFSGSMIGVHAAITTASTPQTSPQKTTRGTRPSSSTTTCSPNPKLARKINETCSEMSLVSPNRAANVRLDLVEPAVNFFQSQTDYIPEPCAENIRKGEAKSAACKRQEQHLRWGSIIDDPEIKQMRGDVNRTYTEENSRVATEIRNIIKQYSLNQYQHNKIDNFYEQLSKLQHCFMLHRKVVSKKIGNCGEYAARNTIRALQLAKRTSEAVKIQVVSMNNGGFDHRFLLINSDTPDIKTQNRDQIKKYLRKLKGFSGNICDSWNGDSANRGYYQRLSRNRNGLYNEISTWNHLEIQTLSLDFDYEGLPKEIGRYFDKKLKAMGLQNQHGKPMVCLHDDEQEPEENRGLRRNEL